MKSTCQKFIAWSENVTGTQSSHSQLCHAEDHQTTIHFKRDYWRLCDEMKPPNRKKDFISAGHHVFRKRLNARHRLIILVHTDLWRDTFQVPRQLSFPWRQWMWTLISLHFKSLYRVFFSAHGESRQGHMFTYKHPKRKCGALFAHHRGRLMLPRFFLL